MAKILLIAIVAVSFMFQACEAFKDHYDNNPDQIMSDLIAGSGSEDAPAAEENVIDYSADATPCENIADISVAMIEGGEAATTGWSEDASLLVEQLGQFTSKITLEKDGESLTFTIKQIAEAEFNVCNISFTGTESVWSQVIGGIVDIYKIENGEVQAGFYSISFDESEDGDAGAVLEGDFTK